MQINGRNIGDGNPSYIIAEMSANHAGSIQHAKEIIHAAKEAGADCLKIQTYTADTITMKCNNKYFQIGNGTWEGEILYSLYEKAYTPWEWQAELYDTAKKVGLDFFSTPFDFTAVDFLEEIGMEFYKIASFELVDIPLIEYVASKGKPIIMSTGMGSLAEIEDAVNAIKKYNCPLALLKCSSAYPAIPDSMNLKTIPNMKELFNVPVGLSDHSMGSIAAVTAVALGANVIEKHFCLSRAIENPDSSFSMEPKEFEEMVKNIRDAERAMGKVCYELTEQEISSKVFRKSIFVSKDIKKGEKLTMENIRVVRPGYGTAPKYLSDLLGMTADRDLEMGEPMLFNCLEKNAILFLTNNENTNELYEWLSVQEKRVYRIQNKVTAEMIEQLQPSFIVSYNYKYLVPKEVIEMMREKIINLHTSYLPYNRGASPNFFSFFDDTPKGVTIHLMSEKLDTGDILCQKECYIDENKESFVTSYKTLQEEMMKLFCENWNAIKSGEVIPYKQSGTGTYHSMKELNLIREAVPFEWDMCIADFKRKWFAQKLDVVE